MKNFYKKVLLLAGSVLGTVLPVTKAQAQREYSNWYFGNQAALNFSDGAAPQAITNSELISYEACSSISSPTGQLLMYSNGVDVWDANHQLMPNGSELGSHNSASQGVLIVRAPESTSRYYIFTVDAIDNNLVGGLRYSLVDMSLRGGLGNVTTKAVRLPTPNVTGKVTEKLTAALHANGRDYWILVHGWETDTFYSFLLSPTGISTTPVVSNAGPVHQGGGSFFGAANAVGYMRVAPNGSKLALAERDRQFELYDYDNSSGVVSNYLDLQGNSTFHYGVEFSPNSSLLYTTMYSDDGFDTDVYQYNLKAGSPDAIRNSQQTVGLASGLSAAIQAGPDGKIYLSVLNRMFLNSIDKPNELGSNCSFQQNTVSLGQRAGQNGLPNQPNAISTVVTKTTAARNTSLMVYPNPARTQATITLPEAMRHKASTVRLFNALGQQVSEYPVPAAQTDAQVVIPVGTLGAGLYKLHLTNSTGGAVIGTLLVE